MRKYHGKYIQLAKILCLILLLFLCRADKPLCSDEHCFLRPLSLGERDNPERLVQDVIRRFSGVRLLHLVRGDNRLQHYVVVADPLFSLLSGASVSEEETDAYTIFDPKADDDTKAMRSRIFLGAIAGLPGASGLFDLFEHGKVIFLRASACSRPEIGGDTDSPELGATKEEAVLYALHHEGIHLALFVRPEHLPSLSNAIKYHKQRGMIIVKRLLADLYKNLSPGSDGYVHEFIAILFSAFRDPEYREEFLKILDASDEKFLRRAWDKARPSEQTVTGVIKVAENLDTYTEGPRYVDVLSALPIEFLEKRRLRHIAERTKRARDLNAKITQQI